MVHLSLAPSDPTCCAHCGSWHDLRDLWCDETGEALGRPLFPGTLDLGDVPPEGLTHGLTIGVEGGPLSVSVDEDRFAPWLHVGLAEPVAAGLPEGTVQLHATSEGLPRKGGEAHLLLLGHVPCAAQAGECEVARRTVVVTARPKPAARLCVEPAAVALRFEEPSRPASSIVALVNEGDGPLQVEAVEPDHPGLSISPAPPICVAPGAAARLTLSADPQAWPAGASEATVRVLIRSNAANAPEAEITATVEPPPVIIDGPPEDDLVAPKLSVSPSSISLRFPGGREFSHASVVLLNTSTTDVMVEAITGVIGLHTSLGGSPVRLAAQQRFTVEIWMGSECSATPGDWLNVTFRTDDGAQHVVRALMLDDEHDLADSPRAAPTTVLDFDDSPRSTRRSGERTVLD